MKQIAKYISAICLSAGLLSGCTGDFEKMNTNPLAASSASPNLILPKMQDYGFNNNSWEYQVGNNLHANLYAQYFANSATYFNSGRYERNSAWASDGYWKSYYVMLLNHLRKVEETVGAHPEYTNMFQIMRIISAMGASRTTDTFGDIPYTEGATGISNAKFDAQKDIYYDIFKELTEAVSILKSGLPSQLNYGSEDLFFAGNVQKWIKLANSLRLRYALRLSFVDAEKAKAEGEAALREDLMASNDDNAGVRNAADDEGHCLFIISYWGEFCMSKTMENMMKKAISIEDPRLPIWFAQTPGWVNGTSDVRFQGVPNGLSASQLGETQHQAVNNSSVWGYSSHPTWNQNEKGSKALQPGGTVEKRMILMNYAEVNFLKAEAALRGWAGAGDVATNYKTGIQASFDEARAGVDPALVPTNNDEAYINGGSVKWDNGMDFEGKLEKIITQKWISMYPNGDEAWAEFRRTGYPKLMPIAGSLDPSIGKGQFIKKLRYVDDEVRTNPNATAPGLNQGQGDGQNVRVWWDTKRYE